MTSECTFSIALRGRLPDRPMAQGLPNYSRPLTIVGTREAENESRRRTFALIDRLPGLRYVGRALEHYVNPHSAQSGITLQTNYPAFFRQQVTRFWCV